jgi:pimeloyl-ACP methyl ester carboxylesterase
MNSFLLPRGGARLCVYDTQLGHPVVFQHGLGGDQAQVAENFPDGPAFRRITVECRAQGGSEAGEERPFSIAQFSADVLAACDALGIRRFILGGISTGAALSLRIAALVPERVAGLVLARPAWLFDAAPENMQPFALLGDLLRRLPPQAARAAFSASPTAKMLAMQAPDNLVSLFGFFDRPNSALIGELLADIAADGPGVTQLRAAAIDIPTLVIGHGRDHIHPLAYAVRLAKTLPRARLAEITPKASDKPRHVAEFRAALDAFLKDTAFSPEPQP